jgi:hypothetical protein
LLLFFLFALDPPRETPGAKKKKEKADGGTNAQKQPALKPPNPLVSRNTYHKGKLW